MFLGGLECRPRTVCVLNMVLPTAERKSKTEGLSPTVSSESTAKAELSCRFRQDCYTGVHSCRVNGFLHSVRSVELTRGARIAPYTSLGNDIQDSLRAVESFHSTTLHPYTTGRGDIERLRGTQGHIQQKRCIPSSLYQTAWGEIGCLFSGKFGPLPFPAKLLGIPVGGIGVQMLAL